MQPQVSPQDLELILSQYRIGSYLDFELALRGTVQTNVFVRTTTGRFVFRRYENRSSESVRFEVNLLRYLDRRGFPCVPPIANIHGALMGIFQEKPYALFQFIEGYHIEHPGDEHQRQLITVAATLQKLTARYVPQYRAHRWNYGVDLCRRLARAEAQKIANALAWSKLAWMEQELSALSLPRSMPKGICHCDLHFTNVLYQDNRFAALLDFDDANYTYLVFDLVGLMESSAWNYPATQLDWARARVIVQEYQRQRPLSAIERQHLFDVYKLSVLIDAVWYFGRWEDGDFYERKKVTYLNSIGRGAFSHALFFG